MTREEAIERLNIHKSTSVFVDSIAEAIDMAIEALSSDAVPHGRLIDADALIEKIDKEMQKPIIDRMPIIDIIATMIGGDEE